MPDYDVIVKKVAPLRVAEVRDVAPNMEKLGPTLDRLFDEVQAYIAQQGAKSLMPAITLYYDQEMGEQNIQVGASMTYEGSKLPGGDRVKAVELPGVEKMASVIHHGSFSTLNLAYEAILKWIEANGYQISGPNRELNLEYERGGDQAKFVTEIQIPIEKA
jgi:effector-binding domain-containing protein